MYTGRAPTFAYKPPVRERRVSNGPARETATGYDGHITDNMTPKAEDDCSMRRAVSRATSTCCTELENPTSQ